MNEQLNLEFQWLQYLKRAGVSEQQLPEDQRREMKRAFYGGCGQMLITLRDEMPEDENVAVGELQKMLNQCHEFWMKESERQN